MRDIKTEAFVLRRTNYGEADRILNLITPEGKIAAIAKGVRKSRSKLAGGVEMFSRSELTIHIGRSEMGTVTGARMLKYYGGVTTDLKKMELAAGVMKRVSRVAESSDAPEYFEIVGEVLEALDMGMDTDTVEAWATVNLAKTMGEEMNLYRDAAGVALTAEWRYEWDGLEGAFRVHENGMYGADEIKILRLMTTMKLVAMARIRGIETRIPAVANLVRIASKMN